MLSLAGLSGSSKTSRYVKPYAIWDFSYGFELDTFTTKLLIFSLSKWPIGLFSNIFLKPFLLRCFLGWLPFVFQIFSRFHRQKGKYFGVTLAEMWNLQENFDYLPHVSWLIFFVLIHILYFSPLVLLAMSLAPPPPPKKKTKRKRGNKNQGHRLQELGAFPDHPMYPAVVSKFYTWWSHSRRTQGNQGIECREPPSWHSMSVSAWLDVEDVEWS